MRGGTRECLPGSPDKGGLVGPLVGTPLPNGSETYCLVLHTGGLTMLAPPSHVAYPTAVWYGG